MNVKNAKKCTAKEKGLELKDWSLRHKTRQNLNNQKIA